MCTRCSLLEVFLRLNTVYWTVIKDNGTGLVLFNDSFCLFTGVKHSDQNYVHNYEHATPYQVVVLK